MNEPRLLVILVLLLTVGCASPGWTPADPDDPNAAPRVTGAVISVEIPEEGDIVVVLAPSEEDRYLLAPGQIHLSGENGAERHDFGSIPAKLEPGMTATAWGYWVTDHRGATPVNRLRPTTALRRAREDD